uniref:MLLT11 transcription factor 7 cofactor n=1 Tax=Equus caballus TaxID=9796 RepID=F6R6C2_HORSE
MPSLSTAPSTSGELPLPASTPSNWTCSKPKTSLSHNLALIVFSFKPLPFHPSPLLILLSPLYCIEVVLMNLPELCCVTYLFIYLFIYLSIFLSFLPVSLKSPQATK